MNDGAIFDDIKVILTPTILGLPDVIQSTVCQGTLYQTKWTFLSLPLISNCQEICHQSFPIFSGTLEQACFFITHEPNLLTCNCKISRYIPNPTFLKRDSSQLPGVPTGFPQPPMSMQYFPPPPI
jgi:hypothetical protein